MTAFLADLYPSGATDPAIYEQFFDKLKEAPKIERLTRARECPDHTFPPSCYATLSFGFFSMAPITTSSVIVARTATAMWHVYMKPSPVVKISMAAQHGRN